VTASGRKAEATKGPWVVCQSGSGDAAFIEVCGEGGNIATVTHPGTHRGESVYQANARLIAEAPAMREALEHFMTWWDRDDGSDEPPADTLSKTRSILARVGGGTQMEYVTVKIPKVLKIQFEARENEDGFRNFSEFVIETVRRRIET
jgi:hypothetical protein